MKKTGMFVLLMALALVFCSCTVTDDTKPATAPTTTVTTTATTVPTVAYTGTPLHMPKSIYISACYSSAMDLTIYPTGPNVICFFSEWDGENCVVLTEDEVETLNRLYESITDFSNLPSLEEGSEDVTLIDGDNVYRFYSIFTTQVELEQYINLLYCYNNGTEYDWSVEPRDLLSDTSTDPYSDYTGVALKMPDSITQTYESYDHTVCEVMTPYTANTVQIKTSESSGAYYIVFSEERIKELNALYDAITDFSGEVSSGTPLYKICRGDETYIFDWSGANQWELDLYVNKIFMGDADEETWTSMDDAFKEG